MDMILVEKYDIAKEFAATIGANKAHDGGVPYFVGQYSGKEYCICCARGHLIGLAPAEAYGEQYKKWSTENFPCFPQVMKYTVLEGAEPYLVTINRLMKKSTQILCATDNDREGDLIFRYIYKYLCCNLPYKRLVYNDSLPETLRQALDNPIDSTERESYEESGELRDWFDWMFGINATALYTATAGQGTMFNVGRVKLPTLCMVVEKEKEIQNFKKSYTYTLIAELQPNKLKLTSEKIFETKAAAEAIKELCLEKSARITSVDEKNEKDSLPLLYNTNSLSIVCSNLYGYSPKLTLDILESLYMAKHISYPRTTSEVVSEDMKNNISNVITQLFGTVKYSEYGIPLQNRREFTKRHFDNSKVESHTAIIPTHLLPKQGELNEAQEKVYDLIVRSILQLVYPDAIYKSTKITANISEYIFSATNKECIERGWQRLLLTERKPDTKLPAICVSDTFKTILTVNEIEAQPPKRYTYSTLLKEMELAGQKIEDENIAQLMKLNKRSLGTPATRGEIIDSLIESKYFSVKGKTIMPTEKSFFLAESFPILEAKSALYTGKIEELLHQIQTKKVSSARVRLFLSQTLKKWFEALKTTEYTTQYNNSAVFLPIPCPRCGGKIRISKYGYYCENKPKNGCQFSMNDTFCGKQLSSKLVIQLLSLPHTDIVRGLTTYKKENGSYLKDKSGKLIPNGTFDSRLYYDREQNQIRLYAAPVSCPICGNPMTQKPALWECTCGLKLWRKVFGKELTIPQMTRLCESKRTQKMNFVSKSGKPYSAVLVLDTKEKVVRLCYE